MFPNWAKRSRRFCAVFPSWAKRSPRLHAAFPSRAGVGRGVFVTFFS